MWRIMKAYIQCVDGINRAFRYRKGKNGDFYICENCSLFVFSTKDLKLHTCKLTSKYLRKKGSDRWGDFFNLSGNEANGHCFWCGAETKRRYCSKQHAYLYLTYYRWSEACGNVHRRIYDPVRKACVCEKCGNGENTGYSSIEIHHIIPLNGEDRNWNVLNIPDNLIGLCKACHIEIHKAMNAYAREKQRLIIEAKELSIQPMLF
jgi:5-methylcytosine-specific restriction endonuclease McrA